MRGDAVTPSPAADTPAPKRKRPTSDPKVLRLIPAEFASRHLVLPLRRTGRTLSVAMADPSDAALIDDLQFLTQFEIDAVGVGEHTLRQRIDRSYEAATTRGGGRAEQATGTPPAEADSAEASEEPAVRLIDDILGDAVHRGASDIHFEPYETELADPVSRGWEAARDLAAAVPAGGGPDVSPQDPGGLGHRGAPDSPGRPDPHAGRRQDHRLPGLDASHAVR